MKSLVLLASMMFSLQVFAVNEITLGNYAAKDKKGTERISLTLGAGGKIPALHLNTTIGQCNCTGTYSLAGDNLKASVVCDSNAIHAFLGSIGSPIVIEINVAGATKAQMASAVGARVSFNVNDGVFEDEYALYRR